MSAPYDPPYPGDELDRSNPGVPFEEPPGMFDSMSVPDAPEWLNAPSPDMDDYAVYDDAPPPGYSYASEVGLDVVSEPLPNWDPFAEPPSFDEVIQSPVWESDPFAEPPSFDEVIQSPVWESDPFAEPPLFDEVVQPPVWESDPFAEPDQIDEPDWSRYGSFNGIIPGMEDPSLDELRDPEQDEDEINWVSTQYADDIPPPEYIYEGMAEAEPHPDLSPGFDPTVWEAELEGAALDQFLAAQSVDPTPPSLAEFTMQEALEAAGYDNLEQAMRDGGHGDDLTPEELLERHTGLSLDEWRQEQQDVVLDEGINGWGNAGHGLDQQENLAHVGSQFVVEGIYDEVGNLASYQSVLYDVYQDTQTGDQVGAALVLGQADDFSKAFWIGEGIAEETVYGPDSVADSELASYVQSFVPESNWQEMSSGQLELFDISANTPHYTYNPPDFKLPGEDFPLPHQITFGSPDVVGITRDSEVEDGDAILDRVFGEPDDVPPPELWHDEALFQEVQELAELPAIDFPEKVVEDQLGIDGASFRGIPPAITDQETGAQTWIGVFTPDDPAEKSHAALFTLVPDQDAEGGYKSIFSSIAQGEPDKMNELADQLLLEAEQAPDRNSFIQGVIDRVEEREFEEVELSREQAASLAPDIVEQFEEEMDFSLDM